MGEFLVASLLRQERYRFSARKTDSGEKQSKPAAGNSWIPARSGPRVPHDGFLLHRLLLFDDAPVRGRRPDLQQRPQQKLERYCADISKKQKVQEYREFAKIWNHLPIIL